ncbi:hypothetical protein DOY81_002719 [Sarcophaga bullata]|nr:hypothetical protein DOY81_002719 [Sarcophaga bullata]
MTAENYHLKWDSHLSYLNSSVATLYKNEKYADVVLYSSNTTGSLTNSMPTVGISAHKFILSSCSQFFSTIFETSPVTNSGIFYIVLPPDLSHRAIQILVQYMYVGEATVSNDILSEVLRGGEILKIRGLCRTSASNIQQPQHARNPDNQTSVNASSYNLTRMPMSSGPTSVRYLMEQQQQQHSRGLGASVMPKDSPVIIKSPKPLSTLASSTAGLSKPTSSGITINKQMAIDPGDKCCYAQDPLSSSEAASSICNEIGCNSCPRIADSMQPLILRRERSQSDDPSVLCRKSCLERCDEQDYLRQASNECRNEDEEEDSSRMYEHELRRSSLPTERSDIVHEYSATDNYANHLTHIAHSKQSIIRENANTAAAGVGDIARLPSPANHSQESSSFVNIKEEPSDWLPSSSSSSSLTHQNMTESSNKIVESFQTTHIKTELSPSSVLPNVDSDCRQLLPPTSTQLQPTVANDFERYFSCDICNKTCEDKASLVRHLESHTATPCSSGFGTSTGSESTGLTKSYVPKKRRRISQQENSSDHVCLQCDLCSTRFETPAEWVRHMSSQHTEVELAMFNNKKDKEKSNSSSSSSSQKKLNSNRQTHQQQQLQSQTRTQVLNGSTNSNLANSTSVLCTSPNQMRHDASTDYLRSTLSPA